MTLTESAPLVQHESLSRPDVAEDLTFFEESDPLSRSFSVVLGPRDREDENSKLTAFETFVTFIKGNTGPGIIYFNTFAFWKQQIVMWTLMIRRFSYSSR